MTAGTIYHEENTHFFLSPSPEVGI